MAQNQTQTLAQNNPDSGVFFAEDRLRPNDKLREMRESAANAKKRGAAGLSKAPKNAAHHHIQVSSAANSSGGA